jgi:hypothetical protein
MKNNYKQTHLEFSRKLLDATLDTQEQHRLQQYIHYIEQEYAYRPRYSDQQLRPRCKHSNNKHNPKHTRR